MPNHVPKFSDTQLVEQSAALAEFAEQALVLAKQLGIQEHIVEGFSLDAIERFIVAELPAVPSTIKKKLTKTDGAVTVADTGKIVVAVSESLHEGEPIRRYRLLIIAKKLIDCLRNDLNFPDSK